MATARVQPAEPPFTFNREAEHREAGGGQDFQVVQLLDLAVADSRARLWPSQITSRPFAGVALRHVLVVRVPMTSSRCGHAHAARREVQGRLAPPCRRPP